MIFQLGLKKSFIRGFQSRFTHNEIKSKRFSWSKGIFLTAVVGISVYYGHSAYMTYLYIHGNNVEDNEKKPKLVVLGTGWASTALLKGLDPGSYDVTVISPTNYFLFTPLLPSAVVGTIELRSLIESIRKILLPLRGKFLEAKASGIDSENKQVSAITAKGEEVKVPYDKLVVAVGSEVNTFGIKGVADYCYYLKTAPDVVNIRNHLVDNFERASVPGISEEEKNRLLSFVIVGAGPSGVEVAAEICDLLKDKLVKYYPKIKKEEVKIVLLEGLDRILNAYDAKISEFTENNFKRQNIKVIKGAMVNEIKEDCIIFKDKYDGNKIKEIPYGLCIWSGGIGFNPFISDLKRSIVSQQNNRLLLTDSRLRVKGIENVYSLGDCSSIDVPKTTATAVKLFKEADVDNAGTLDLAKFDALLDRVEFYHPQIAIHFRAMKDLFNKFDDDKDGLLTLANFKKMLEEVDKKTRTLPATAQVAAQEGKYLAKKLNQIAKSPLDNEDEMPPFTYRHLGSLVYTGDETAAIDFGNTWTFQGYSTYWLWRSIYFSEQISIRTRTLVLLDWIKCFIFGRDFSRTQ